MFLRAKEAALSVVIIFIACSSLITYLTYEPFTVARGEDVTMKTLVLFSLAALAIVSTRFLYKKLGSASSSKHFLI